MADASPEHSGTNLKKNSRSFQLISTFSVGTINTSAHTQDGTRARFTSLSCGSKPTNASDTNTAGKIQYGRYQGQSLFASARIRRGFRTRSLSRASRYQSLAFSSARMISPLQVSHDYGWREPCVPVHGSLGDVEARLVITHAGLLLHPP